VRDPENGNLFWSQKGKGQPTPTLMWDGKSNVGTRNELVQSAMDYPYTFTVTDTEGQTSKKDDFIPVDVLVIWDGNNYKMQVPAITFRPNEAVMDKVGPGLTKEQVDKNMRVLRRIAVILNKFKEYTVVIEGHANNLSGCICRAFG
jgi:outer membrane protein OmpA-like peptidoglycan-associated protein